MTDERDEKTRLVDHEIWVQVMGNETPNEVMGYSLFALPSEIAALACILLAHSASEPPILSRFSLTDIGESLERTLRYESNARGARDEHHSPS